MELAELKSRMLKLLKEDEEFRYAVAGLIGLSEVLERLDEHGERMVKLEESMVKLEERMVRVEEELVKLREDMVAGFKRHDEILERHAQEITKLREDMVAGFKLVDRRLRYLEAHTERVSLTLEEEAAEVISGKLSRRGVEVKLDRLILPDMEINIYGATGDVCVVGEAATRAGVRMVKELDNKLEELAKRYPEYMRRKAVKVLYTMWIAQDAVEEAERRNVWVLKTTQELTPLNL